MPLFSVSKTNLATVDQTNFDSEKHLQTLIEKNLQTVFGCRLVASEYSTGAQHAGRIDTLALSEDNNPVIVEYKKVESSDLINQSLFYLAWIQDHRGDFEIAAQKTLGPSVSVDWSGIRVICIAPNYKKYDLHAAQVMGADLELWTYRLFTNGSLYLEEVFQKSVAIPSTGTGEGNTAAPKEGNRAAAGQLARESCFPQLYIAKDRGIYRRAALQGQTGGDPGAGPGIGGVFVVARPVDGGNPQEALYCLQDLTEHRLYGTQEGEGLVVGQIGSEEGGPPTEDRS